MSTYTETLTIDGYPMQVTHKPMMTDAELHAWRQQRKQDARMNTKTIAVDGGKSKTVSYQLLSGSHIQQVGTKARLKAYAATRTDGSLIVIEARDSWTVLDISNAEHCERVSGWNRID